MVRNKKTPAFITEEKPQANMGLDKCHTCDLAINRKGEGRPGIRCKDCKNGYCNKCAELTTDFCDIVKGMGKDIWNCKDCDTKSADMRAVLESMNTIKSELGTIKQGQAEQQVERAQVWEGLKAVKDVAIRMEKIEGVQEKQDQRLSTHEEAIKEITQKREEGEERIKKLEEQMQKIGQGGFGACQCNAVDREVREIEKREKNIVIFNVAESVGKEAEEQKRIDMETIKEIFKELDFEDIQPVDAVRTGKGGRFPRGIRTTLCTTDKCD